MMSRSKSLSVLAAVLAAGVTLGALIPPAMSFITYNGEETQGIDPQGVSGNAVTVQPFEFNHVSVENMTWDQ